MAIPSITLISALKEAAAKIKGAENYQWGHMGLCNCGFLAQSVTQLSKAQIHSYAMRNSCDWSEHAQDYCVNSKMPFDLIISEMIAHGLELIDLVNLERLTDNEIIRAIPKEVGSLKHNDKRDVALYMSVWADLLESQLSVLSPVNNYAIAEEL
jgi:hypothetical protein